MKNERVGLGFSVVRDVIGPTNSIDANLSYAYHIPLGKAKLSIALQGGAMNWRADWSKLDIDDVQDDAFSEVQPNFWLPNFGAGIYFYSKKFYIGFASPKLIEYDLRKENLNTPIWAKQHRHYYLSSGAAFPLNGDALVFKPSILIKNVGLLSSFDKNEIYTNIGAPTEIDIDISFMFYQTFWFGVSFRTAIEAFSGDSSSYDSVDIWAAYYLANGLRIGAAYDYSLTEIRQPAQGSFEIMLGYEFNYVTKQAATPRYF
jgi:type IX secretion system PorP/SprF family membrane protein